jgi:hypothetical protein
MKKDKLMNLKVASIYFQRADVNGTSPDGVPYDECCTNDEIRALILKQKKSTK